MIAKIVVLIFLLLIAYTLGSSLYFLMVDKGQGPRTVRRLSWRIGFSALLLIMIYLAVMSGWLKPGSAGPVRYRVESNSELAEP